MARIVVVATTDIARETLGAHVAPDDELAVIVPAVEQSRLDWLANDETGARTKAAKVGESIAEEAPTEPSVVVKPDPPSQAVVDAVAEHDPDRILVVLRTGENATWLEDGETGRIPADIEGVPVSLITV